MGRLLRILTFAIPCVLAACPEPEAPNTTAPKWVEQQTPHAEVALVFVHGLFGDTLETWKHPASPSFFELLQKHERIAAKVDMLAFGYASRMFESGSFDIQEAANTLYARLQNLGALEYPAMAFVAHSMGGLVVLKALLTHRTLLERTQLLVFYAAPQEGAQITAIARRIADNPALEQMLPADRNGYLRALNDEWRAMRQRPPVRCAYEKRPTHGVMIVPWESATRFCDGAAIAIDADHVEIVKPEGADHDSLMVLTNALDEFVTKKTFAAKLVTPDFTPSEGRDVFTLTDPLGRARARFVNAGAVDLRYTLAQVPDALHVFPSLGPTTLRGEETQWVEFALGFGAERSEYDFVLQSDVSEDRQLRLLVPDLSRLHDAQQETAQAALVSLSRLLDRYKPRAPSPPSETEAQDDVVETVRETLQARDPLLGDAAAYVLTADLLDRVNWPEFATRALEGAVAADPSLQAAPGVQSLRERTQMLAKPYHGDAAALATGLSPPGSATPFTEPRTRKSASALAERMKKVPALALSARSLQGDLALEAGDRRGAIAAYKRIPSPSAALRVRRAESRATGAD